ncbi:MAG: hypothetical protein ACI8S6_003799 [Myxococcota bacterium]|jgi:hypothetical protein
MLDHTRMLLEHRARPGAIDRAEKLLRRLAKDLPADPDVAICSSRVALIREDLDDAAAALDAHSRSWPDHPSLLAQRAAVALAASDPAQAAELIEEVLWQDPTHPHALILRARMSGQADDRAQAEQAVTAQPGCLLAAELTDTHHHREPQLPGSEPQHFQDPADLVVQRDLGGLQYEVSTWEQLHRLPRVMAWSMLGVASVVPLMTAGAMSGERFEEVFRTAAIIIGSLSSMVIMGSFLVLAALMLFWRSSFRAQVTVDRLGMRIQSPRSSQHISWSSCEDLRRKGRLVEVFREGVWQALPSPNSVVDAQWLEALVADQLAARPEGEDALPEDAAAALQALRQRT